jgi:hypothetical protein
MKISNTQLSQSLSMGALLILMSVAVIGLVAMQSGL